MNSKKWRGERWAEQSVQRHGSGKSSVKFEEQREGQFNCTLKHVEGSDM